MSERQRRMIDEAEKSCARLVAMVAELSEIGKLDSGALKLNRQPVELFSMLEQVAELVHEASIETCNSNSAVLRRARA